MLPGVALAVDDEPRHVALPLLVVPLDVTAHDRALARVGDLRSVLALFDMPARERAAHALEEPLEDRDRLGARIAEDLKLIAAGMAVLDLERLESDV